jgi:hypothetical protein
MFEIRRIWRFGFAMHSVGWILFLLAGTVWFNTPYRRPLLGVGLSLWGVGLAIRTVAKGIEGKARISDQEQTARLEKLQA